MIQQLPSRLDLESILAEINLIDFWKDGSMVEMCVRQSDGIPFRNAPTIMAAVAEIASLRTTPALHLMINKMPSKVIVPIHRDFLKPTRFQNHYPILERWHLPIVTNDGAWWWDEENDKMHMEKGYWYGPMLYWKQHQVGNDGETVRIHLIVDLDTEIPIGTYK